MKHQISRFFIHKPQTALLLIFLLIYILPLGVRPMAVPDEPRYGEIPREMIASGDWVSPRLNGLRYFEKPVMGYWLNAVSILAFGENAFAVRFPSALSVGISALALFVFVRRFSGGTDHASLTALVFLTCFEVMGVGVFSVLDSMLAMFLTLSLIFFYCAYQAPKGSWQERRGLMLFGACCGGAFLTKGFLAFVVPVVTVVPFMIWQKEWRDLFRICWIPLITAVLVSLPWSLLIHQREPDFWHYFFWNEHVRRFMADDAQHKATFWYYFLLFPAASLPWGAVMPAALVSMNKKMFESPLLRFAVCWFCFPFLFFSASSGKILTYILPCFPPFAMLLTAGLENISELKSRKVFRAGALVLAALFVIVGLTFLVVQMIGVNGIFPYSQGWKVVLAFIPLMVFAWLARSAALETDKKKQLILFGMAPLMLMAASHFIIPDDTIEHKCPGDLLLRYADRVKPETVLVSIEDPLRAVCWYYKRDDVYQLFAGGELMYGLEQPDARHRLLTLDQFKAMIKQVPGRKKVVLIAKYKKYKDWRSSLPKPVFEENSGDGGYVFAEY